MFMRALSSRSTASVCLAVAAALVSITCGGGTGPEAVTGPEVALARAGEDEAGQVSALVNDKDKDRVSVCHYDAVTDTYSEVMVHGNALDPHLDHGDFEKPTDDYDCTLGPQVSCPCFTAAELDAAGQGCDDYATQCLQGGGDVTMSPICVVNDGTDDILGTLSTASSTPYCEDPPTLLTAAQYQACFDEMVASVFVETDPSDCGS